MVSAIFLSSSKGFVKQKSPIDYFPYVPFKRHTLEMTDWGKHKLDSVGIVISKPDFFRYHDFFFGSFTYKDEFEKDSMMGIKRSIVAINYLVKKFDISRNNLLIRDDRYTTDVDNNPCGIYFVIRSCK
jgi:hypothetical protein